MNISPGKGRAHLRGGKGTNNTIGSVIDSASAFWGSVTPNSLNDGNTLKYTKEAAKKFQRSTMALNVYKAQVAQRIAYS